MAGIPRNTARGIRARLGTRKAPSGLRFIWMFSPLLRSIGTFPPIMYYRVVNPKPILDQDLDRAISQPRVAEARNPEQFKQYAHQSELNACHEAQDVALDRLLVDRFKQGIRLPRGDGPRATGTGSIRCQPALAHHAGRRRGDPGHISIRGAPRAVNFRGDSAFSTWLYQIATNLARKPLLVLWRRKRATRRFLRPAHQLRGRNHACGDFSSGVGDAGRHHRHPGIVNRINEVHGETQPQAPRDLILAQRQKTCLTRRSPTSSASASHGEKPDRPGEESLRSKMGDEFK